jgi:hypothetical protein
VSAAPGTVKGSGDSTRPCKGGEGKSGGTDDRGRGDERGQSRVHPWRGRARREVA